RARRAGADGAKRRQAPFEAAGSESRHACRRIPERCEWRAQLHSGGELPKLENAVCAMCGRPNNQNRGKRRRVGNKGGSTGCPWTLKVVPMRRVTIVLVCGVFCMGASASEASNSQATPAVAQSLIVEVWVNGANTSVIAKLV